MTEKCGCSSHSVVRLLLGGVLLAIFVRFLLGPAMPIQTAQAQLPDPGAQRIELLREIQQTNVLLEKLLRVLAKDTLKVNVQNFEDNRAAQTTGDRDKK